MLKRGGLRLLTFGETSLAQELYGHTIQYNKVWIHHGSYLPFGMQENNTAMTPNGEIWFETNVYQQDYSLSTIEYKHLFLHEMMHVWQHQRGMNVKMRGLFSWARNYHYDLGRRQLSHYPMEQQACIVADYWLLIKYGFRYNEGLIFYKKYRPQDSVQDLIRKYKKILEGFPQ
ncbi:type IV secretion protein Rhs [Dryocola sp. BD586]|uniref:type IV secretion protein Rhs n=1 Tax=Dryocola sp. BD586 TaxID=3133271 RepID=UPI003F50A3B6